MKKNKTNEIKKQFHTFPLQLLASRQFSVHPKRHNQ